MRSGRLRGAIAVAWAVTPLIGCAGGEPDLAAGSVEQEPGGTASAAELVLEREIMRIDSAAAAIDSIFQPLPLLTPSEEASLRRFQNAEQLSRARALGVERGLSQERLQALVREGRLVRLTDSEYWVVRGLDHSQPLVIPGVRALLAEIGERFQDRLATVGAPPYRVEVSSVLRTAGDQAALRRVNPNAALGESTHEYGTTVDLLYSAFSAPARPILEVDASGAEWLEPHLERHAEIAGERVAARRSREVMAILGQVLIEMQREGTVMVTLERQQPVYHMTLARDP